MTGHFQLETHLGNIHTEQTCETSHFNDDWNDDDNDDDAKWYKNLLFLTGSPNNMNATHRTRFKMAIEHFKMA